MFKCKVCNKEFELKSQLAGHSNSHIKTKKRIAYEENPKLCLECNQPISYSSYVEGYKPTFCSVSCRAKHFFKINPNNLSKNKQN